MDHFPITFEITVVEDMLAKTLFSPLNTQKVSWEHFLTTLHRHLQANSSSASLDTEWASILKALAAAVLSVGRLPHSLDCHPTRRQNCAMTSQLGTGPMNVAKQNVCKRLSTIACIPS